jgi:hypothetical protein
MVVIWTRSADYFADDADCGLGVRKGCCFFYFQAFPDLLFVRSG